MYVRTVALTLLFVAWSALAVSAQSILVMVEEAGCPWCARFDREIAEIYPKTWEGRAAPLRRINIHGPYPDDMRFDGRFSFTPTFVLVIDGAEVSRIEGYPGGEFFWGLLDNMLRDAGIGPVG